MHKLSSCCDELLYEHGGSVSCFRPALLRDPAAVSARLIPSLHVVAVYVLVCFLGCNQWFL
jgi:hypothetical protein